MLKFVFASCLAAGLTLSHGTKLTDEYLSDGENETNVAKKAINSEINNKKQKYFVAAPDFYGLNDLQKAIDDVSSWDKLLGVLNDRKYLNALTNPTGQPRESLATSLIRKSEHNSDATLVQLSIILKILQESYTKKDKVARSWEPIAYELGEKLYKFAEDLATIQGAQSKDQYEKVIKDAKDLKNAIMATEKSLNIKEAHTINYPDILKDIKTLKNAHKEFIARNREASVLKTSAQMEYERLNKSIEAKYFAPGYRQCVEALTAVAKKLPTSVDKIRYYAQSVASFAVNFRGELFRKVNDKKDRLVAKVKKEFGGDDFRTKINKFGRDLIAYADNLPEPGFSPTKSLDREDLVARSMVDTNTRTIMVRSEALMNEIITDEYVQKLRLSRDTIQKSKTMKTECAAAIAAYHELRVEMLRRYPFAYFLNCVESLLDVAEKLPSLSPPAIRDGAATIRQFASAFQTL